MSHQLDGLRLRIRETTHADEPVIVQQLLVECRKNFGFPGRSFSLWEQLTYLRTGLDYLQVFEIEMAEGRFFTEEDRGRGGLDVVVNETFARLMGDGSPVGKTLRHKGPVGGKPLELRIIGVVRDFHFKPINIRLEIPVGGSNDADVYISNLCTT